MLRSMYYKYCHGYQELPEERIPLSTFQRTVTSQPAGYQQNSNRWYPDKPAPVPQPPNREITVFTKNLGLPSQLAPAPTWDPHLPTTGGMMRYTQEHNGCISSQTLQYTSPYQYYFQQCTLRAGGCTEEGRVIANPAAQHSTPSSSQQFSLNPAAQQFTPNGVPFSNPYFEMNNLRYQLSRVSGNGSSPGNPFLAPNHFASTYPQVTNRAARNEIFNPHRREDDRQDKHTNTTLQLTNRRQRNYRATNQKSQNKSRDCVSNQRARNKSRDKTTSTNLVLGAKKRRQRPERAPHRRLVEHAAAPGAERRNSLARRDSAADKDTLVMEIKVENSEEFILESMKESPEPKQTEEQVTDTSPIDVIQFEVSQTSLDIITAEIETMEAVVSPVETTCIEDVLNGIQEMRQEPAETIVTTDHDQSQTASTSSHLSPQNSQSSNAQSENTPVTPLSPGFNKSPLTPVSPVTPLTPVSVGFEWCEEYEYELVEEGEEEEGEEAVLELELHFELDSPEANKDVDSQAEGNNDK